MKNSDFMLLAIEDDLVLLKFTLPSNASGWLFHIGFWDEMNEKYKKLFGEHESEDMSPSVAESIAKDLRELLYKLPDDDNVTFTFMYAWDNKGNKLYNSVVVKELRVELLRLAQFLEKAVKLDAYVYCEL